MCYNTKYFMYLLVSKTYSFKLAGLVMWYYISEKPFSKSDAKIWLAEACEWWMLMINIHVTALQVHSVLGFSQLVLHQSVPLEAAHV